MGKLLLYGSTSFHTNTTVLDSNRVSLDDWHLGNNWKNVGMATAKYSHLDVNLDLDQDALLSTFGLVQLIVLIMTSLIGSGANLLILIVVGLTRKLQKLQNIFIFNQALIDFLICAVFLPTHTAILARNFPPPGNSCDVIGVFVTWFNTASFLGLPAIAYARFILHTRNPHQHRKFMGPALGIVILSTIWLFPLLLVSPAFFGVFSFEYSHKARDCFIRLDKGVEFFLMVKSFILFIGPVFGIFFIYFRIYDVVKSKTALVDSQPHRKCDVIVTQNLFGAFLICVVCLLPFNLAILSDRQGDVPSHLFRGAISLTWVSKATNPLLFMIRNRPFTRGLWGFLYRLMGREDLRRSVRARAVSL